MYTHISLLTWLIPTCIPTYLFTHGLYLHVYPHISTDTWLTLTSCHLG